ncbi:peptidoglycan recognition protein-like [Anticarsia gemmatalis]|uniref:peptidoglycan recognition protein-like n=1 Tax=Anticarsia gemmatalis TaxID=129554 RepID=UPI003F75BDCD
MCKVVYKMFIDVFALCIYIVTVNADCGVVSKKEWDGLTPVHVLYLPRPVELVIIHHAATSTCTSDSNCEERVRAIQSNHMENLGYWDIIYSFIVGGTGKIYEGTGWLHVGAHTIGYNKRSIAISFIGNFNNDTPTPESLQAVKEFLQCGVESGHLTEDYYLIGHRQLLATESPGRKLYNEIRKWPHWLEDISQIDRISNIDLRA